MRNRPKVLTFIVLTTVCTFLLNYAPTNTPTSDRLSKDYDTPTKVEKRSTLTNWFVIDSLNVQCNQTRVNDFLKDNPKYLTNSNKMRLVHQKNLKATKRALDSLSIPFFISHGSLLGWYRECDFILHTHDIDFGVPNYFLAGRVDDLVEAMKKEGLKLHSTRGNITDGFELSFHGASDALVDIFIFYNEDTTEYYPQGTVSASLYLDHGFRRRMLYPMTSFVYTTMADETVLIPKLYSDWVITNYGPDWNKPKSWHYWSSPYNPVIEDELPAMSEQEVIVEGGKNLIRNPSFESVEGGQPQFWETKGLVTSNEEGREPGTRGVRLETVDKSTTLIYQDINLGKYANTSFFLLGGWTKPDKVFPPGTVMDPFVQKYQVIVTFFKNETQQSDQYGKWLLFKPIKPDWVYKAYAVWNPYRNALKARVTISLSIPKMSVLFDDIELRPVSKCKDKCVHGSCVYGDCKCEEGWFGVNCDSEE